MAGDTTTSATAPDARFLVSHPAHFIALGFGSGLAPRAPGTFGTLAALVLFLVLEQFIAPWIVGALAIPLFFVGIWASDRTARDLGVEDHGAIVIDEIVAFLPVALYANKSPLMLAVAFGLFRLFDVWKPFPIRQVERRDDRRRARGDLCVHRDRAAGRGEPQIPGRHLMKDWPYPKIVAHRGGGSLAPENTLGAIRLGQALGFRMHEFDVKLSRDGVAMLLHDPTLERTTNGKGRAADMDWAELRKLDAGAWHSEEFRGEPPASFEDAARLLRSHHTMAHIEIKPTPGFDVETGRKVAAMALDLWRGTTVPPVFSSFSFDALMAAKEVAPGIPRGWLISQFTEADYDRMAALDAASVHTNYRKFPMSELPKLHGLGYRVLLYTVNEVGVARSALEAGIDGVITDNLREFAESFADLI